MKVEEELVEKRKGTSRKGRRMKCRIRGYITYMDDNVIKKPTILYN
jgi:hypothetical protein